MNYKGFKIEREEVGRSGTSYRYRCGNFIAPRKKDVKRHIDNVIRRQERLIDDLRQLNEVAGS